MGVVHDELCHEIQYFIARIINTVESQTEELGRDGKGAAVNVDLIRAANTLSSVELHPNLHQVLSSVHLHPEL